MPKAKVILYPYCVPREKLENYVGDILYRTSGPVKILAVKPRSIDYEFIGEEGIKQSYEGKGFFKPVFYIIDRDWDDDDRQYDVVNSDLFELLSYLPELRKDLYALGLNPIYSDIVNIHIHVRSTANQSGLAGLKPRPTPPGRQREVL